MKRLLLVVMLIMGSSPEVHAQNPTPVTNGVLDYWWNGTASVPMGSVNPLPVTIPPASPVVTTDNAQTQLTIKASPTIATGGVKYFHAENATATTGYCILYNATAAPGTGALTAGLVLAFQLLPASGYCDWTASNAPIVASAGAVVLISSATTPFTYTTGVITAAIYGLAQ